MKGVRRDVAPLLFRICLILVLALVLAGATTHPGRVVVKALLILPEAFPDASMRPLLWVSSPPRREEYAYASAAGPVDVDLYLPAGDGRHGAIVLGTGAFGLRRDPAFARFAEALARCGAVVMVPESEALRSGEMRDEEVDTLLRAIAYVRDRPEVDPARIGVAGFSVGGSMALLAAEDDTGRQEIAFLNVFGAYFDLPSLLRAVASRSIDDGGQQVAWEPTEVTEYMFTKEVINALADEADRDVLFDVFLDKPPVASADVTRLSQPGRLAQELLEHPSAEGVDRLLAALPPSSLERLADLSPATHVDRLATHLYILHGRADHHIPVTRSRQLAIAAPAGVLRHYTELEEVEHVRPDRMLDGPACMLDFARLFHHLWLVGQEFL
jgi:dienelactone hydrolase